MNRKLLLTACLVVTCYFGQCQPYFQKSLGATNFSGSNDIAYSTYKTWDGGYIVCGSTQSYGAGSIDAYLVKFDSAGTQQWAKTYGTTNWEATFKLIITNDSGYLFAGGVLNTAQTDKDILLIKTDGNGVLQWSKKYGGIGNESASDLESIEQTTDGGYIVTGVANGYDTIASDNIFLLKTNALGDTLWTKIFTAWNYDQAKSVHQTFDGGYIISGRTVSFGAGQQDALLIKTDSTGLITWQKCYGGIEPDEAMSVKQTLDSGYIFTGASYSFGIGFADMYITKTDANGTVQWSKDYGALNVEASYSILQALQGGYTVVGFTESFLSPATISTNRSPQGDDSSNVMLIKIDTAGVLEWAKIYGGLLQDEAFGLSQASDSSYLISAITNSFGSDSTLNGYLIHTDKNGNLDCNTQPVSIAENTVPTITATTNYNYSNGFTYSNYNLTETSFVMDDNTIVCLTTGITENETKTSSIKIVPNPVNDKCTITVNDFKDAKLFLYDVTGRILLQQNFNTQETINTSSLTPAMYVVQIKDAKGNSLKQKIVKTNY